MFYIVLSIFTITGGLLGDFTAYRQGVGTYKIFPDIYPENTSIQLGARNFYNIKGTIMFAAAYNENTTSFSANYIALQTYYRSLEAGFAIRHSIKGVNYGICVSYSREFLPVTKNSLDFSISTGISITKALTFHTGISSFPSHVKLPALINIDSPAGITSLYLEGEKYMPLRVAIFQTFLITKRISFLIFFSTTPYKIGVSITFKYGKLNFTAFSEIHDILGQSSGALVEYAPFKSYN